MTPWLWSIPIPAIILGLYMRYRDRKLNRLLEVMTTEDDERNGIE